MSVSQREGRLIIACFEQANGEQFNFTEAGAKAGFNVDEANDLAIGLENKGLFDGISYGDNAIFTSEGRELARSLVEREEQQKIPRAGVTLFRPPQAPTQQHIPKGTAVHVQSEAEKTRQRLVRDDVAPTLPNEPTKPHWRSKIIHYLLSRIEQVVLTVIGGVLLGFAAIWIFHHGRGDNVMDPSSSKYEVQTHTSVAAPAPAAKTATRPTTYP